jgi:hypothetical protein
MNRRDCILKSIVRRSIWMGNVQQEPSYIAAVFSKVNTEEEGKKE